MNTDFAQAVAVAIHDLTRRNQLDQTFYYPTQVTLRAIDAAGRSAAWVMFEHTGIRERCPLTYTWREATFRYSLWRMREGNPPEQLYSRCTTLKRLTDQPMSAGQLATDLHSLAVSNGTVEVHDCEFTAKLRFGPDNELLS